MANQQGTNQALHDINRNLGPANTTTWAAPVRQAYDAVYNNSKK